MTATLATDPPTSEAQRRAMFAAAAGKSNLGIPKKVGEEFSEADPGGKLPEHAKDMDKSKWGILKRLFLEWMNEEEQEPEHAADEGYSEVPHPRGAGVIFATPDGMALFLKRAAGEGRDHAGEWCFPGGMVEPGESDGNAALREAEEETGQRPSSLGTKLFQTRVDLPFTTYLAPVEEQFKPKLNDEHSAHAWAPLDDPPEPLHPGVRAVLDGLRGNLRADEDGVLRAQDEPFERVERSLAHKKGVNDPKVLAAWIGREHGKIKGSNDVEDPTGRLSESTRKEVDSEKTREDMPEGAFLGPNRTYPVKEERDGEWRYTRNLLLAAARRARMQGRTDLARRADSIRAREFPDNEDEGNNATTGPNNAGVPALPRMRQVPKDWGWAQTS